MTSSHLQTLGQTVDVSDFRSSSVFFYKAVTMAMYHSCFVILKTRVDAEVSALSPEVTLQLRLRPLC